MFLFACTLRHPRLAALLGVGKHVVLFCLLTLDQRHKWVDVEQFILDPLPGAKEELVSSKASLARSRQWYGQEGLDAPIGASQSSICSCDGRQSAPCRPLLKAKYCQQWLIALGLYSGPPPRRRETRQPHVPRPRGGRGHPLDDLAHVAGPTELLRAGGRPVKNTAHRSLWAGGQQFEKRVVFPVF